MQPDNISSDFTGPEPTISVIQRRVWLQNNYRRNREHNPSNTSLPMKTNCRKKPLTFGDFVASSYHIWGKRRAAGIIRLAIKSHLIEFRGHQRIAIS
jgi:hypothetical protein